MGGGSDSSISVDSAASGHHDCETHSVFQLGPEINSLYTCICVCIVIVAALAFDVIAGWAESACKDRRDWMEILRRVYTELMVLGLVSFFVFVLQNSYIITHSEFFLSFEFGHIFIFFVALIFVIQASIFAFLAERIKKELSRRSLNAKDVLTRYRHAINKIRRQQPDVTPSESNRGNGKYRVVPADGSSSNVGATLAQSPPTTNRLPCWLACYLSSAQVFGGTLRALHLEMEFNVIRDLFFRRHSLPDDFDYAAYMQELTISNIAAVLQIDTMSWVAVLCLFFFNIMRLLIFGVATDDAAGIVQAYFVGGWLLLMAGVMLYMLVNRMRRNLLNRAIGEGTLEDAMARVKIHDLVRRTILRRLTTAQEKTLRVLVKHRAQLVSAVNVNLHGHAHPSADGFKMAASMVGRTTSVAMTKVSSAVQIAGRKALEKSKSVLTIPPQLEITHRRMSCSNERLSAGRLPVLNNGHVKRFGRYASLGYQQHPDQNERIGFEQTQRIRYNNNKIKLPQLDLKQLTTAPLTGLEPGLVGNVRSSFNGDHKQKLLQDAMREALHDSPVMRSGGGAGTPNGKTSLNLSFKTPVIKLKASPLVVRPRPLVLKCLEETESTDDHPRKSQQGLVRSQVGPNIDSRPCTEQKSMGLPGQAEMRSNNCDQPNATKRPCNNEKNSPEAKRKNGQLQHSPVIPRVLSDPLPAKECVPADCPAEVSAFGSMKSEPRNIPAHTICGLQDSDTATSDIGANNRAAEELSKVGDDSPLPNSIQKSPKWVRRMSRTGSGLISKRGSFSFGSGSLRKVMARKNPVLERLHRAGSGADVATVGHKKKRGSRAWVAELISRNKPNSGRSSIRKSGTRVKSSLSSFSTTMNLTMDDVANHEFELRDLGWLKSPKAVGKLLNLSLLFNAMFLAGYASHFASMTQQKYAHEPYGWWRLALCPIPAVLLMLFVAPAILREWSVLVSVLQDHPETLNKLLQKTTSYIRVSAVNQVNEALLMLGIKNSDKLSILDNLNKAMHESMGRKPGIKGS